MGAPRETGGIVGCQKTYIGYPSENSPPITNHLQIH
jgi:hypothetical protein